MISTEDSHYTYAYSDYFKVLPQINNWDKDKNRIKSGVKVASDFTYSSNNNSEWMTKADLQKWIGKNKSNIGKI